MLRAKAGCTVEVEPVAGGVVLRATHSVGQGRWLSAPHPLDGSEWPTAGAALAAAREAGLMADGEGS